MTLLARGGPDGARCGLVLNPALPVSLLEELAADPCDWVRAKVAACPRTPLPVVLTLSRDLRLAGAAGINTALPGTVQAEFAGRSDPEIREALARNPALVPAVAERLSRPLTRTRPVTKEHLAVLRALAKNPATPAGLLDELAWTRQAGTWRIHEDVAQNPAVSDDTLQRLAVWGRNSFIRELATAVLTRRLA